MIGEKTFDGLELSLSPQGRGRLAPAFFLLIWLCFWAVGELMVLAILFSGLIGLLTGGTILGQEIPSEIGLILFAGGFLFIWLILWTIGGWAAFHELFRLLWAEDRIVVQPYGFLMIRKRGPFKKTETFIGTSIKAVYIHPTRAMLMAQVGADLIEISGLGTPEERLKIAALLRDKFNLPESGGPVESADAPPSGWVELRAQDGRRVLLSDPKGRRQQAMVVAVIAFGVSCTAFSLARDTLRNPNLGALAAMSGAAAVWLIFQAIRLYRERLEWVPGQGRLILRRRRGEQLTELAGFVRLELTESADSDGDLWYELTAVRAPAEREIPLRLSRLMRRIHDPDQPRLLGQWISRRAEIPLDDRIPDAKTKENEHLRAKEALAASGRFGRFLVHRMGRKTERNRQP